MLPSHVDPTPLLSFGDKGKLAPAPQNGFVGVLVEGSDPIPIEEPPIPEERPPVPTKDRPVPTEEYPTKECTGKIVEVIELEDAHGKPTALEEPLAVPTKESPALVPTEQYPPTINPVSVAEVCVSEVGQVRTSPLSKCPTTG